MIDPRLPRVAISSRMRTAVRLQADCGTVRLRRSTRRDALSREPWGPGSAAMPSGSTWRVERLAARTRAGCRAVDAAITACRGAKRSRRGRCRRLAVPRSAFARPATREHGPRLSPGDLVVEDPGRPCRQAACRARLRSKRLMPCEQGQAGKRTGPPVDWRSCSTACS